MDQNTKIIFDSAIITKDDIKNFPDNDVLDIKLKPLNNTPQEFAISSSLFATVLLGVLSNAVFNALTYLLKMVINHFKNQMPSNLTGRITITNKNGANVTIMLNQGCSNLDLANIIRCLIS